MRNNRAASLSYTHTFSPTLLNEFRYGMALNNNPRMGALKGNEVVKDLGLVGLVPDLPDVTGIFKIAWSGLGLTGLSQTDWRDPGFRNFLQEFQDHLSWFRGRHNLKAGVNFTRVENDNAGASADLFGNVTFSNRFTGHPYADFLLGIPTSAARAFPFVRVDRLRWQYDFFVQDDIKLSPRLTVNLGLRYEYHPLWVEEHGRASMFDIGSGKIVVQDGSTNLVSPLMPKGYVNVVEARELGLPGKRLIRNDRNNLLPRIGVAYRPWGERTVFRGGFGLFYDLGPWMVTHGGIPFVIDEPRYTNPAANPDVIFPRVFPATTTGGPSTVGIPAAVNASLPMPYSMQYSLTIERTQWETGFRLSYNGTNTRQGSWSYDYNSPVPDNRPFVDKPRPFPAYPGISYVTNGAGHQYHGLTTEVERRMAGGVYLQGSWVWARDIGDLERGGSPENPFDRRRERSVWPDIPTHRVTTNWLYQFPVGPGKKFLGGVNRAANLAIGGWELSGIYSYYSGMFLTPTWTGPDPVGTTYTTSRTAPNVTLRPDILRNPNLPSAQRSVNRWFDAGAFAAPAAGRFGTSAKGVIKGPWVNVWHMGLIKNFHFGEKAPRLRWELTATNIFNHPNWSNSATSISTVAQVGVISGVGGVQGASTGDNPWQREFRMGVRLEW